MRLTWLGHSAFLLNDEILIDPWISNPLAELSIDDPTLSKVKYIFLTHGHSDHVGEALEIAEKYGAKIIAVYELTNLIKEEKQNIECIPMNVGGVLKFDNFAVKVVPAVHSSSYKGRYAGCPVGYVFYFDDCVVYHAGDTALFGSMRNIRADIALLPVGGRYTMDIFDAVDAARLIKPGILIPMHYNTFPEIEINISDFEDLCSAAGVPYYIMEPGETFSTEEEE